MVSLIVWHLHYIINNAYSRYDFFLLYFQLAFNVGYQFYFYGNHGY
jgi:hypothetical protein